MKYKRKNKDLKLRGHYKKIELFQKVLKIIFFWGKNKNFNLIFQKKVKKSLLNVFKTEINNYCVITCRSRGISKDLKVSRIIIRSLGAEGLFFGLKKGSW